tara:strand:+ start:3350 stop:4453 length:1104 start_codon:yes stop_codon:yes gene_type:complete
MDSIGGSEIQSIKLAKKFSQKDNQVFFWSYNVDFDIYPELNSTSKHIRFLKSSLNSKWFFSLINTIKDVKPDVIYTRDTRRVFAYNFISRLVRVPLIYNINHDVRVMPYNISQLKKIVTSKSKSYGHFPAWAVFGYFTTRSYVSLSKVVTQTNLQSDFLKSKNIDSTTIYNGIKLPSIRNKSEKRRRLILWVGSLKKEIKRPHIFLQIAKYCEHLDVDFKYCGGLSNDKIYNRYLMENSKNISNIEYLGELTQEEVYKLLDKSYLLINTSKFESFPNTFIEAWVRGVPVISKSVNPDNFLKNSCFGFKETNISGIIRKIEYLITHPDKYNQISKETKSLSHQIFDLDIVVDKYLSTFSKVIESQYEN